MIPDLEDLLKLWAADEGIKPKKLGWMSPETYFGNDDRQVFIRGDYVICHEIKILPAADPEFFEKLKAFLNGEK